MATTTKSAEQNRLSEDAQGVGFWKRWGPYVSERSWGTVREDYSANGDAWGHLTHDMARSKAYRWSEDGLAGYCDRYQLLSFSLALWNKQDPILKERAFGLVPSEGNHGEDVKEYYFYLDSTPTHSYMKYLYKYPQAEFPYTKLVEENQRRGGKGFEYELLDTGIFDENRYFDVFVEYAKHSPDTTLIKITAYNRGPEAAPLHIIPQLTLRNTWAWSDKHPTTPNLSLFECDSQVAIRIDDRQATPLDQIPVQYQLGELFLFTKGAGRILFTNNESNNERLYGTRNSSEFVKDAFHRHIIHGEQCINPKNAGTKAAVDFEAVVPAGESYEVQLILGPRESATLLNEFNQIFQTRQREADDFYEAVHPPKASEDEKMVQRQALAGLLWTKQFYCFDVQRWLKGDDQSSPPPESRNQGRNVHWKHLNSMRILSMPDKWEYPWFAAWDLAFHCVTLGLVDIDFAKEQLWLMLFEQFQHPNGQIPAYEWEFSDLNPPVHAWAVWRLFHLERVKTGHSDLHFLEKCFHKLLINFTWWVNKVDNEGNNIFEGGFLGLDNITVFDRSEKLPDGYKLEQADATGWMGAFCLSMMRTALELSKTNSSYEALATKFFQHYVYVGAAIKNMGGRSISLWDESDGFFHDVLRYPDGSHHPLKLRSLVGIIPLYAAERIEEKWIEPFSDFSKRFHWFVEHRQDIVQHCCYKVDHPECTSHVLTIFDEQQLLSLLSRIFDESEFLSRYGIRSLSRVHRDEPFHFAGHEVRYEPAESDCKIKGGNSNWRGPIWFPTSYLIIESLKKLNKAYGPHFTIKVPARAEAANFEALARELADRLISIFLRNKQGERPVFGGCRRFQDDPHWRDYVLFYEYFHGDNGAGLGASHQSGWTALVASLIDEWRR
jgi:hypothetical protein